jgi:hypothetical protein
MTARLGGSVDVELPLFGTELDAPAEEGGAVSVLEFLFMSLA